MDELVRILPDLKNWAYKFSGPHYDPDDLVSDVLVSFLKSPEKWSAVRGPLKNYLFSFIKNRSYDALKAYNRKGRTQLRQYLQTRAPLYSVDQPDVDPDFLATLEGKVRLLPDTLQKPLSLHAFDGKSYREIGEELGVTVEHVRLLIYRARKKLKEILLSA